MPKTNDPVLKTVLRNTPPTDEEWRQLIIWRLDSITLVLPYATVHPLWDHEFTQSDLKTPLSLETFRDDIPPERHDELKMQGIYAHRGDASCGDYLIWGFNRKERWVTCEFKMRSVNCRRHISRLGITESRDPEIVHKHGVTYYQMWKLLSSKMESWAERRRQQLQTLEKYNARMQSEDELIAALLDR